MFALYFIVDQGASTSLDTNQVSNKPLLSDSADSGISVGVQSRSSVFEEVQIDVEKAECLYTTQNQDDKSTFECEKNVAHVKPYEYKLGMLFVNICNKSWYLKPLKKTMFLMIFFWGANKNGYNQGVIVKN